MRVIISLILAYYLFRLISAQTNRISPQTLPLDETDALSICEIIPQVTSDRSKLQDVLLVKIGHRVRRSILGDISKCLNGTKAVVIDDLTKTLRNDKLKKAAMIVIETGNTDQVKDI